MIRTPLRPLARILEARERGENPDAIERENMRLRHEEMRDRLRQRAESRLLVMAVMFFCGFLVVGVTRSREEDGKQHRATHTDEPSSLRC